MANKVGQEDRPPEGNRWDAILRYRSIEHWKKIKWQKELLQLEWSILNNATINIINGLIDSNILGINNVFSNLGNTSSRINRIIDYIIHNHQLPSTLIFLKDNDKFDVVDGCHRLMVYFMLNDIPQYKNIITKEHIVWIGYH